MCIEASIFFVHSRSRRFVVEDDLGSMVGALAFSDEQSSFPFHSYHIHHLSLCDIFRKLHVYVRDTLSRTWGHYICCLFLDHVNSKLQRKEGSPSPSHRWRDSCLHVT